MKFSEKQYQGLTELLKKRRVIPGFAGEFDHKGVLECLTSKSYERFFSREERKLLKLCVPWTRVIWKRETDVDGERVNLLDYIKEHKDILVIKPNKGAGGERVLIGREVSQLRWEKRMALTSKEKGKWVVQRYVDVSTRPMAYLKEGELHFNDCYFSFGLFYYLDRLGLHCRISPSNIVNVARGGALACAFVLRR